MTLRKNRFESGIELTPANIKGIGGTDLTREGEIDVDSDDSRLKVRVEAATRTVVTEDQTQPLTNKTINVDNNTVSNIEVDNLKVGVLNTSITLVGAADTQLPSALAVKTYVDNKAAAQNEASEILFTPAGTIVATNVQAAIVEVSSDIDNHIADTIDAHDASAISSIASGNLVATDVQAALNELDSEKAKLAGDLSQSFSVLRSEISAATDATTTGSNASLAAFTQGIIRLTNASLVSVANIPAGVSGQQLEIINRTGVKLSIIDSSSVVGVAANRIFTGSGIAIDLAVDAALLLEYDTTSTRWQIIGGSGSGSVTDTVFTINDAVDPTKQINFDAGGTTGTKTTIAATQTDNRVVTLPDLTDTLVSKTSTDVLTNKSISGTTNTITNVSLTAGVTGVLPTANGGTGLSTVGSESQILKVVNGVPAYSDTPNTFKNYITATDGKTIGMWVTYADAAGTNPVDGTGGVATATYAVSTNSDLRGTTNFLFTHTAANNQGNGFSYDFTIEPADKTKVLQISFDYLVASGTYADDDLQFWIYDVTNATLIQPAPFKLKNSGIIEKFALEFQASTSSSYRLIGHVATATATAYTLRFTNWRLGQQQKAYGSAVTDWVSYTPTFTGFGVPTGVDFKYKKVGDVLQVTGTFAAGTVTAVSARISLPVGLAIDTSKVLGTQRSKLGDATRAIVSTSTNIPGTAAGPFIVMEDSTTSTTEVFISTATNTTANTFSAAIANAFMGSGDSLQVVFEVPISGWSSSQVMSNDADTRVVASAASATSTSVSTATPNITFTTTNINTNGAFDGTAYTVKTPGLYRLNTNFLSASVAWSTTHQLIAYYNINGGSNNEIGRTIAQVTGTYIMDVRGYALLELKAGDVLRAALYSAVTQTPLIAKFSIERISGPSQIAASESVSVRYKTSAAQSLSNGVPAIVNFNTKVFDSHNAVTTGAAWKFIAPMSGKYLIQSQINLNTTSVGTFESYIQKNVTIIADIQSLTNSTNLNFCSLNATIDLLAGDSIDVSAFQNIGAISLTSSDVRNYISITRVGN